MYNEPQYIGVWGWPQIGGNIRRAALPIDGPWARMAAGVRPISPACVLLLADRAAARLRHYAAYATQLCTTTPGRSYYHPGGAARRRKSTQYRICAKQKFSEILHIYAKFPNLAKCWAPAPQSRACAWLHSPSVPYATAPNYRGAGPLRLAPQPPAPLPTASAQKAAATPPPPPVAPQPQGWALQRSSPAALSRRACVCAHAAAPRAAAWGPCHHGSTAPPCPEPIGRREGPRQRQPPLGAGPYLDTLAIILIAPNT